jgi:riboflavin kinase/FMN adenylyltransferase
MNVIRFNAQPTQIKQPLCLTIGNFDGVHFGHQQIILQLKETAKKHNLATGLLTFLPHPMLFFKQKKNFLLHTFKQKIATLQQFNLDYIILLPFNHHFANLSHYSFIEKILLQYCQAKTMIVGYDFTFGKNKLGNIESLMQYNICVQKIECQKQKQEICSSSLIRQLITEGKIKNANQILTRQFSINGKILSGQKLARKIGFPTINIKPNHNIIWPKFGVYQTQTSFVFQQQKIVLPSITNFGIKPTINNNQEPIFETHLFNWQQNIYNQQAEVEFIDFLRPEHKFNSILDLQEQIKQDIYIISNKI